MKTTIWLLLVLLIGAGCSTSKEIPSQWVSEDFKNLKIERMLVYASTEDTNLQKEFEDKMVKALAKEGITLLKMHDLFPEIKYTANHSQEEINEFVLQCNENNIDKVLLASQKSITVDTVVAKSLHNYFNSLEPLKMGNSGEDALEYDKKELITYTLEAAIYDIATSAEDKPIATTTLKATDPRSPNTLKKRFLNAIVMLFKSR
jgi:hypothetical protein